MKSECGTHSSDEWKVVVARNFEEIEAIRPIWEQMQRKGPHPTPDADIDRYLSVIEACSDDVRPCVLLLEYEGCPAAIIIGRIEKHQWALRLGYKSLFKPTLRCLSVVYGGILGQPEGDYCSLLIGALRNQLRAGEVDVVYFNHLRTDTAFYQAIRKIPGFLIRGSLSGVEDHWHMSVPESMDRFYLSRSHKSRYNLRRAVRKFEEDYPCKDQLVKYTTEADVDDFIQMSAGISSGTYQDALGVGIVNDERTRSLMKAAATHGRFRGHVLLAGDKPCAFQFGLCFGRIYYLVNIGYDPAFRPYQPGTVLFLRFLESLCDDPSTDVVDFYFGDAWYKKRYGTEHWPETCVWLFAPRAHLIFLNALQNFAIWVNAGLKCVVRKIGAEAWIKRGWRNVLRARS
ncbi:MAG: GNAT family N-acetyltransferase [Desulfobacteraceae bacterium]|nr:GNAT family N-acetyltransferase [Desulfobacteraceae bacterium]